MPVIDREACRQLARFIQLGIASGMLVPRRSAVCLWENGDGRHRANILAFAIVGALGTPARALEEVKRLRLWSVVCEEFTGASREVQGLAYDAFMRGLSPEQVEYLLRTDPNQLLPGAPRQAHSPWQRESLP